MKLATKRSLKEFHISYASGSGDGVDILSKVLDEQQQTGSGTNKGAGDKPEDEEEDGEHDSDDDNDDEDDDQENDSQRTESDNSGDEFVHPTLSAYKADEEEEEKAKDDDEVTADQKVSTPPDYELTKEDENQQNDDTMGGEQEDEEDEELEVYVTLTTEPPIVQQQSSSVSSDLVAKFINPSPDTGIDSILNPNIAVSVTPSSDTTIPQPPIPIIQPQQQTHDSKTTITIPTTTLSEIPNFASLFGFDRKVSSLEIELSELKQTNQFAEDVASIPGIVDNYLTSKMKDEVNVALQLKSDKLREEAQAENQDFLNSLDSNMKRIIKEQVKAQTSKIMTKVENYVTKTLGAKVLVRSTNQPQTSHAVAYLLSELELKNILMDKMEENNSIDRSDVQKNLYRALLEAFNSDKDLLSLYGEVVTLKRGRNDQDRDKEPSAGSNRGSPPKSSGKSVQEEEHDPRVDDLEEPFHQEFDTRNDDVSFVREATDVDERLWNPSGSRTPEQEWNQTKTIRGRLIIPYDHFINNDLEYLKGGSSSRKYITSITKTKAADYGHVKWIKDKIPRSTWSEVQVVYDKHAYWRTYHWGPKFESYQKKINLTKPDTYRSVISKKTPYTAYRDIQGIIYQDDMNRNRLMRADKLHKLSDGTLNHVRTSLNDIATGIQMEYLPK
ncbi:hypothetical protein Tco_1174976 [Tanacetum coccineum]